MACKSAQSFCGANPSRTLKRLLLVLLLVLAVRNWLCAPALVSGNSMLPTLHNGQFVIVNKVAYLFHTPVRGDLISIWTGKELIIKRIIGLPGEEIALHDGKLYVNGKIHPECYLDQPARLEVAPGKIPPNCYAVAGDNRLGTILAVIKRQRIVGKLMWS